MDLAMHVGAKAMFILPITLVIVTTYRLRLHYLSRIPGPFPVHVIGLWRTWRYKKGNWHKDIIALHEQYGKAFRISVSEISVIDEDIMRHDCRIALIHPRHRGTMSGRYPVTRPLSFTAFTFLSMQPV
jgi:hypothetical protein